MSFMSWLRRVLFGDPTQARDLFPSVPTGAQRPIDFDNGELNGFLLELANAAWTSIRPGAGFLLDANQLGYPLSPAEIERTFGLLYTHAGMWAPGLATPAGLPRVRISLLDEGSTAGQYTHDGRSAIVTVAHSTLANQEALLLVLGHEACHHILALSSLNDPDRTRTERKTDLAMYICGFGEIAARGYQTAMRTPGYFSDTHMGYLRQEEHDYAAAWVLHHRSELAAGAGPIIQPEDRLHKRLLSAFFGDTRKVERWVRYVRGKHPELSTTEIYQWILDNHETASR